MLLNDPQLRFVWCFFMIRLRLYSYFVLQEYHKSGMPFSVLQIKGYVMPMCLVIGEVDLDHSVTVVCQVSPLRGYCFSLCNKYLGRDTLRLCKYTIFPQTFAQYFDMHWWMLLLLRCLYRVLKGTKT